MCHVQGIMIWSKFMCVCSWRFKDAIQSCQSSCEVREIVAHADNPTLSTPSCEVKQIMTHAKGHFASRDSRQLFIGFSEWSHQGFRNHQAFLTEIISGNLETSGFCVSSSSGSFLWDAETVLVCSVHQQECNYFCRETCFFLDTEHLLGNTQRGRAKPGPFLLWLKSQTQFPHSNATGQLVPSHDGAILASWVNSDSFWTGCDFGCCIDVLLPVISIAPPKRVIVFLHFRVF